MEEESWLLLLKKGVLDRKTGNFYFFISNEEQFPFKKSIILLVDPTYDSTFQILFGIDGCEERLKDLLNALLFPDKNGPRIESVKFLSNEKRNKNSLRSDISCEIDINGCKYVVGIEMQRKDKGYLNKRLFNYGTTLRNNNQYKDYISLGFSCSSNIITNHVWLEKTSKEGKTFLDYIKTIEINVDHELSNISDGNDIFINGKKINNEGKEFIKLFGLNKWAVKQGNRYAIPDYRIYNLSQSKSINECFGILSSINDEALTEIMLDEQYYQDIVNENRNYGFNQGFEQGKEEGFEQGREEGKKEGKEEGKKEGWEEGKKEGWEEGKKEGREEGKKEGIEIGYNLGIEEANKGLIIGAFLLFSLNYDIETLNQYIKNYKVQIEDNTLIRNLLKDQKKDDVEQFIKSLNFINSS